MQSFLDAYIETALWSSSDESTPQGGEPMDTNYGPDNIHLDTLALMRADCEAFQTANAELLARCLPGREWSADAMSGHNFWLDRNAHGCGFWSSDSSPGELGQSLSDACKPFGEFSLYVGDDDKIHGSNG